MKIPDIEYLISSDPPPNYERAQIRFGVRFEDGVVFTYGRTIHTNRGEIVDKDLLVHELTHVKQQTEYPGGEVAWWDRYFIDDKFRLDQELEAYATQYKYYCAHTPDVRNNFRMLTWYASCLLKLYDLPNLTRAQAMNLIKDRR